MQCESLKIFNVCKAIAFIQLLILLFIGLYAWLVEGSLSGFLMALVEALVSTAWIVQGMPFSQIVFACLISPYLIGVLILLLLHVMHFVDVATFRMLFSVLLIISIPVAYTVHRQEKRILSELESCP